MRVLVMSLIACWAGIAQAEQYWVSYDADDGRFPEECGWTRHTHGGGAVRSISDGILTLDSTASSMICDYYRIDRPVTPGVGETFVAEWRVCVGQHSGFPETLACVEADDGGDVLFEYWSDHMGSYNEGWQVPIASGMFHTYRLESGDRETYSFWIDGDYARSGAFGHPGPQIPFVAFGDGTYGTTPSVSLTRWDYFGFGIVPEPNALAMALTLLVGARVARGSER